MTDSNEENLATDGAQMDTNEERFNAVPERIIGSAFKVGSGLGTGFLEKCYENALAHELRKAGLMVQQQVPLQVFYDGIVVGEFVADLIVECSIVVELKAIDRLAPIHSAQCINYLAATGLPICLSLNFSSRVEAKRLAGQSFKTNP